MGNIPAVEVEVEPVWASVHEEGMQLELWAEVEGARRHLVTFLGSEADETLLVELYSAGRVVRFPVAELEKAIASAKEQVHSESWYDRRDDQHGT